MALLHGPVHGHVEVVDVEVAGEEARHPDVVNPEELCGGGGPGQGGRSAGVGDVEPTSAVSWVEISDGLAGDFLGGNIPLAGRVSLTGNSSVWTR